MIQDDSLFTVQKPEQTEYVISCLDSDFP